MRIWRAVVLWCTLLSMLVVCGVGLWTRKPWEQEIWTTTGWRRLTVAAAIFTAFWLIANWRKWPAIPMLAGALIVLTTFWTTPIPIVAVLYFVTSSWALGRLLLRREPSIGSTADELLSALAGVAVWQTIIGLAAHLPVNSGVLYFIAMALPIAVQPRLLGIALQTRCRMQQLPLAAGLPLFALVAHWAAAMRPEVSADGLAMHLVVPKAVAQHGEWGYDVTRYSWAVMPLGGDWAYTAVYLLGGEWAAHLLNIAFLCATAALVMWVAACWTTPTGAALCSGLFLATPLVHLVTGNLFIENFQAVMLLGALVALSHARECIDGRAFILAGILSGAAMSAKFGTLAYAAPLLLLAVFTITALPLTHRLTSVTAFLALAAIPYATAFILTGNPVFPFMNATFQSTYFDTATSFRDLRFATPLSWRTPYDAVLETHRFLEAQDGALSYGYLVLAPITVVTLALTHSQRWLGSAAAVVAITGAILTWLGASNVRYCYPALPMMAIALAAASETLRASDVRLFRAVLATIGVCVLSGLLMLATSGWWKDFLLNPFDSAEQRQYMETFAPGRLLVEYLNGHHSNAPVLFLVNGQTAGLRGRLYLNSWHNETFYRELRAASTIEAVGKLLQDQQIQQLVVPTPARFNELPNPVLRQFVTQCTPPEYEVNGYAVASLRAGCGENRPQ